MDKRKIGNIGEDFVCRYLVKKGCKIEKRNFCIKGGEIDIIASKQNKLFFVEVKTRMPDPLVSGETAITRLKKEHIIKTARAYLREAGKTFDCRFDVAVVTFDGKRIIDFAYYDNAFDASKR